MNKGLWWRYNSFMRLESADISSGRGYGCSHSHREFVYSQLQDSNTPGHMQDKTLKWLLVLCLSAKSRQLRGRYEAGAGPSLLTYTLSKSSVDHGAPSAREPILSCYFTISQFPRKHAWALPTVIPQPIPHYTVSKYLVRPCFKTLSLTTPFLGPMLPVSCLQHHLPSAWSELPTLPWRKALFLFTHTPPSVSDASCTWEPPFCMGDHAHMKQWEMCQGWSKPCQLASVMARDWIPL